MPRTQFRGQNSYLPIFTGRPTSCAPFAWNLLFIWSHFLPRVGSSCWIIRCLGRGSRPKHVVTGRVCQVDSPLCSDVPPPRRKGDLKLLSILGTNIQSERRRRKLTQEKMAELLDLYPRAYQRIEAGVSGPSVPTLIRIQAVLECPWDRLMAGVKYPPDRHS